MERDSSFRFRQLNDYAVAHSYLSGFPNCWEANYDGDLVRGSYLLSNDPMIGIEWRDIPAWELRFPPQDDLRARFRATSDWCARNGYYAGFPNFHHAYYDRKQVYGTILFRQNDYLEWRDIPAVELGNPPRDDIIARFRAISDWCARNGYYAGFPNFHHAYYNGTLVYGHILFKANPAIQWIDIREAVLKIYDISIGFRFDARVTYDQKLRLLRRHSFARDRVRSCNSLSNELKNGLITAYQKRIRHRVLDQPNCGTAGNQPCANARAGIGGDWMDIDFGRLFPEGDNEIAQTLIHEMMHSAGYNHPNRRERDRPGDNGEYYGTPPLQAELCIAGIQSVTFCKYEEATKSFRISQPESKVK